MQVDDVSRQQFSKFASRGFQRRMTLTGHGLVLGAGTLLAKLDDKAFLSEADQERIWTFLSVAYGHELPLAYWDRFAGWRNSGKEPTRVLPRFIWRRWACRTSARTPPTAWRWRRN